MLIKHRSPSPSRWSQNNPRALLFSALYLLCSFPLVSSMQRKVRANAKLLEVFPAGEGYELFGFFKIVLAYLPSASDNNERAVFP